MGEVRRADPMPDGSESIPRVDVLGVGISIVDLDTTIGTIGSWIASGRREYVCVTGLHGVMESQSDPELLRIHNASGLTIPDGMPMVWSGRFAGFGDRIDRVAGPDMTPVLLERSVSHGWKHFFYGGADGVPDKLADVARERFPGIQVVGGYSPPFRPLTQDEESRVADMINASGADIVWVGLSTPKQERWMATMRDRLQAPALLGVGAAFDFMTGRVSRAPLWMQRSGLEWLYRILQEPRRLAKRYLVNGPRFAWGVLRRPPRPMGD